MTHFQHRESLMSSEKTLYRSLTPPPPYFPVASNASALVAEEEKSEKSQSLGAAPSLDGLKDLVKIDLKQTVPTDFFGRAAGIKRAIVNTAQKTASALVLPKKPTVKQPEVVTPVPFEVAGELEAGQGSITETKVSLADYTSKGFLWGLGVCASSSPFIGLSGMSGTFENQAFLFFFAFGYLPTCTITGAALGAIAATVTNAKADRVSQTNQ